MALTKFTENMQAMLPQWMKMAKDPDSVGAQFLDSFGMEFLDIQKYLENCLNNQYIGTANIGQIDFCYKVPLALPTISDMADIRLAVFTIQDEVRTFSRQVNTLKEFYEADESVCIVDRQEGYLYINPANIELPNIFTPFDAIAIDSATHYEYSLHHIWNVFDEFGLLLGIYRLAGEKNADFKERILDVFRKPANATKEGLENAISRELGVDTSEIELGSLADKEYMNQLTNPDGTPTKRLMDYVNRINTSLGFSWDNMNWGEAYWRSLEEANLGFYYLPHIWDGYSPFWKDHEIQSGVGGEDDLKVEKPRNEDSTRNFKAYVGLRGTVPNAELLYPEVHFKYKIVAKGKIPNEEYKVEDYKYTVVSSEIIPLSYLITAAKQFIYETKIDWIANAYVFEDTTSPGMEVVTGEDVLHRKADPFVKLIAEFQTSNRQATARLSDISIEWEDTTSTKRTFTLTTAEDLTQKNAVVNTDATDVYVTGTGEVELSFGEFYAVVDTEGAFMQGSRDESVSIQKDGSITLNI